jgi:hypothetical protein
MLIKTVLCSQDSFLVTAPRRFGKSINLDMLKRFLCIECDETGNRKTRVKETEPVKDTDNYRLLTDAIPKLPS